MLSHKDHRRSRAAVGSKLNKLMRPPSHGTDHHYISLLAEVEPPVLSVTGGRPRVYRLQNGPALFELNGGRAPARWALPISASAAEDLTNLPPCEEFPYFLSRGMVNPYKLARELWAQFLRTPDKYAMARIIFNHHLGGTLHLLELKKYGIHGADAVRPEDVKAMGQRRQEWDQMSLGRLRLTVVNRRGMQQRVEAAKRHA